MGKDSARLDQQIRKVRGGNMDVWIIYRQRCNFGSSTVEGGVATCGKSLCEEEEDLSEASSSPTPEDKLALLASTLRAFCSR